VLGLPYTALLNTGVEKPVGFSGLVRGLSLVEVKFQEARGLFTFASSEY